MSLSKPPCEWHPAHAHNFSVGRGGLAPIAICNHEMQGTLAGTLAWFANPAAGVSSTYGIGASGRIVQFVRDADTAYANGPVRDPNLAAVPWIAPAAAAHQSMNALTISIEWEGWHTGGTAGRVAWRNPAGRVEAVTVPLLKGSVKAFWQPTAAQYQAGLQLIRYLVARHSIPVGRAHICRHSDFDSVSRWFCPGSGFPLARLITDLGGKV